MPSGYTNDLPADTLLDTAVIMLGGNLLSATRGGTTFDPGDEIRNMEYDGKKGDVAGLDRKVFMAPTIQTTLLQSGPEILRAIFPGSTGSSNTVNIKPAGEFFDVDTDYLKNLSVVWRRGGGGTVTVTFPIALASAPTIGGQDRSEGELPVTFQARQDPADLGENGGKPLFALTVTNPS